MTEQQKCDFYIKRAKNIAMRYGFTHDDYLKHTAPYKAYYAQMRQLLEDSLLSLSSGSRAGKTDWWGFWNPRVYTQRIIERYLRATSNINSGQRQDTTDYENMYIEKIAEAIMVPQRQKENIYNRRLKNDNTRT